MFRSLSRGLSTSHGGISGLSSGAKSGKEVSSTVRLPTTRRSSRRPRRRANYEHLRGVLRVNNPEADMRPIMPHREALLAAVLDRPGRKEERRVRRKTAKGMYYDSLRVRSTQAAIKGDVEGLGAVIEEAKDVSYPLDRELSVKLALISPIAAMARRSPPMASAILTHVTTTKLIEYISRQTLGLVLDTHIRGLAMSRSPDKALALRGVSLSTLLDTPLKRSTYNALIRLFSKSDILLPLSLFYRALQKSIEPNVAMYNALLSACFNAGHSERAEALMEEMRAAGVCPNGDTFDILLGNAETAAQVDLIFGMYRKLVLSNAIHPSPGHAQPFIQAYISIRCSSPKYLDKAFSIVDAFHDFRVGASSQAITVILEHCIKDRNAEGALHALRELRRGWYAPPARRLRRALTRVIGDRHIPKRVMRIGRSFESVADKFEMQWISSVSAALEFPLDAERSIQEDLFVGEENPVVRIEIVKRLVMDGHERLAVDLLESLIQRRGYIDSGLLFSLIEEVEEHVGQDEVMYILTCLVEGKVKGERKRLAKRARNSVGKWIEKHGGSARKVGYKVERFVLCHAAKCG